MQLPPQSISCFRSRKQHFVYLLLGLMLFCGVEAKAQSSLLGRVEAMFHDLFPEQSRVAILDRLDKGTLKKLRYVEERKRS